MKKRVAFLTTIFPMEKAYLDDFFNSLLKQTDTNFDVIVINDGYVGFKEFLIKFNALNIIELQSSASPAKNREFGINYVMNNNYDVLIFGDSDDYFSENRVEDSINLLGASDIVINDLSLFNETGILEESYLSNRLDNKEQIDSKFIEDKNVFGFTNTAVNLKNIKNVTFQSSLIAVDWFFYATLLNQGLKAVFTNNCTSYYRQHESSLVGLGHLTISALNIGIAAKKNHYKNIASLNYLYDEMDRFSKMDRSLVYLKLMEVQINHSLWWEEIREIKS